MTLINAKFSINATIFPSAVVCVAEKLITGDSLSRRQTARLQRMAFEAE
jgi:hypothetical protein